MDLEVIFGYCACSGAVDMRAAAYRLTERVTIFPAMLTGRIVEHKLLDGEHAYTVELDDQKATSDGTYCARETELK